MNAPWPCRNADAAGTRRSPCAGATRGMVGPRWSAPKGLHLISGPVVGPGGRIALAIPDTVLLFPPDFRHPAAVNFPQVRHVSFTSSGDILVSGVRESRRISPDGTSHPIETSGAFEGKPPAGLVELVDGDLYAWRDTQYARLSPGGEVRYQADLGKGMGWFGSHATAISPGGARAHAMAMSWSSPEDPTEYYGTLLAVSADGVPLFKKDRDHEGLPTSTGLDLRLMALPEGILLAESGACFWGWDGAEQWAESHWQVAAFVRLEPRVFSYVREGRHLMRVQVPERGESRSSGPSSVFEVGKEDWIHDVVGDAAGRLYLAERSTLIALDERGKVRFRALVPGLQSLVVGDGFLLAVQQPLAMARVD